MTSAARPTAFVIVSTAHGTMLVNRHDYRLVKGGGIGVGFQLLQRSVYDPDEVDIAVKLLQLRRQYFGDGVVAIDCGANIGVHTIEWAKAMHGWGEVLAFEAQERIFYALAGNITMNNCFNARAVWAAVGAQDGSITVPQPNYLVPSSFGSLEIRKRETTEFIGQEIDYADGHGVETRLLALDGLSPERLDLLKIDVEGMELEVLKGADETLRRCRPQVIVEAIKSDEAALRDRLAALGYQVFPMGNNLLALHETDPGLTQIRVT
ncbi:FkbM family methyltransferase [Rhodoplanes sp. TEM]|uniref:FkbM family methyltransferase n=1 Tax=Rhodoplanes tepidamans TaxID=200616 RepID=A0ABT5JEY4_RHOTP|nr:MULTISPECIES: FkbM family methyltransferase [Rhodoplanes]MDC7788250.1 FkbM family methyltransferase [Rhodoplanes tepidamans]MDC7982945.1 FkbM family methyltransferase [Rhodoplanes sp. TEM]MDQ0355882.1 FkbM family methyltransferase [Rhodoplanes tepidamans]